MSGDSQADQIHHGGIDKSSIITVQTTTLSGSDGWMRLTERNLFRVVLEKTFLAAK
ncbi:hypothetical protein JCM15548_13002 [Geofilum rubicundum JCM 15548]|uniref:Uncharacterized protein n=1 Tax=Geofilum rubicundum JCM 15548 TaxID=1236989 RepID=A0A0E9LZG3_9BACT|nr:hypothetical protein JCM15548_13002 [Geofilum rubicundum JCM 15548]